MMGLAAFNRMRRLQDEQEKAAEAAKAVEQPKKEAPKGKKAVK